MTTTPTPNVPALWTALRAVANAIRLGESDTCDLVQQRLADLEACLATFGVDTARDSVRRFRDDRSPLGDVFDLAVAYCDLAIERIPLHRRVDECLDACDSLGCTPYRALYLLAAFGLDLNPDDAVAHDFPREWEDQLEVEYRDRIGDLYQWISDQVPNVCGLSLAVHADIRGHHDRHAAVSCPTEAEAHMLLGTRDLAAADSLVAIPFTPIFSGPGTGRFIIVDFETRTAFTRADLDRCRGVS